jgi:hypothetical protein
MFLHYWAIGGAEDLANGIRAALDVTKTKQTGLARGSMESPMTHKRVPVGHLVRYYLRLGALGFGGPVALCGQMERELVEERHWLTCEEMREGIAVRQSLPGAAGDPGRHLRVIPPRGLLGGPRPEAGHSFCRTFSSSPLSAPFYMYFGGLPPVTAIFYGVSPAVIALILHSCHRLAKLGMEDRAQWVIAAVCLLPRRWVFGLGTRAPGAHEPRGGLLLHAGERGAPSEVRVAVLVEHAKRFGRPANGLAADLILRLGIARFLGARPAELSRGERRRLSLFTALCTDRPVVVLDEPLGVFDPLSHRPQAGIAIGGMSRHRYVAIVLVSAAWLTACGGTRRGASVAETPSQLAPSFESPVVSAPPAPPPPTGGVPTPPVTTPPVTAPALESRDKQLEILTQAVIALHQEVARNDAQSEKLLKENERLRAEVDSLLRDLDKSRDANQRVRKKLRVLQERLRTIAESPLLATADQREGHDESAELSPPASGDRAKQKGGSAPGGATVGKPARGRDLYHVVVAGDTLFGIATAYGVDYREVASENGIEDPAHIEVGQRIFISGATRVP